ncbi:RagB/SusD family nutrient uptake outer membrane protein [Sphingobacterium arenae]|uniref:RagB/SusD family nutrient uptake outer membrane protein n=1 Tax=Sphingobacterium arenae TaxID=1280598 RepID=A0ABR7XZM8_9SPHI|nr:RagB/SusD family nutrient uptake outer membrane protein [Sphingobacterium arenae]MBD1424486.1 RagB/SusD family nutrient uptake outer membrane protein [Sphingobacterium arenae]
MKRIFRYIYLFIMGMTVSSCNYLDIVPDNVGTLEYAFRNRNEAENYLFGCYSTMQRLSDVIYNPGFTTSAEVVYPILETQFFNASGFNLIRGTQNSSSPVLSQWGNMYKAIRRCNIMLENIDQPIDLREAEKRRWIAETKFLKAYYHYYLIRMYGPIILIDENNPVDVSIELTKRKRATLDESFTYVVSLMDEAIPDLPPIIENRAQEFGRITKFIAMAVKAEMLVWAASPLFNGNPDYIGYQDKDGRELFPSAYDPQKWRLAADACKEAIEECEAQGLRLYDILPVNGIRNVSDELKEVLILQNILTQRWEENPELIWSLNHGFDYQGYTIPKLTMNAVGMSNSYPSNWAVPFVTTELFYTRNGVPINEDVSWDYANRFSVAVGNEANQHYIKQGYETVKAHFDRERRFYAALGFDGGIWFGNGQVDEETAYHVQARGLPAIAGPKSLNATNITGYWPKKLTNYLSVMDVNFSAEGFRIPMMRLAGLYLLYAEALNEVESSPTEEVYEYIDRVRHRAGLAGVREAWSAYARSPQKATNKDGMRQIIRQERRIELAFEGQSGWDLRRWKELQGVLGRPLQGWSVQGETATDYYRPVPVIIPSFSVRDYLWPLNNYDVVVNEHLKQNPYW